MLFSYRNYYEKIDNKELLLQTPFDIPNNWHWVRSKTILKKIQYGYNGAGTSKGNFNLLRITDIQNNKVNWNTLPFCYIDKTLAKEYQIQKDDILIARTGGTIGKSFTLSEDKENVIFAGYLIRFQLVDPKQSQYIQLYLGTPFYWKQVSNYSAGTGQPNINAVSLGNLLISIPPLGEQVKIVKKMIAINNLIVD